MKHSAVVNNISFLEISGAYITDILIKYSLRYNHTIISHCTHAYMTECSNPREKVRDLIILTPDPEFVAQQGLYLAISESVSQWPQIHIMSTVGFCALALPSVIGKLM